MGGRSIAAIGLGLVLLGGCGAPAASPPPADAASRPLPSWDWAAVDIPRVAGGSLNSVAGDARGFVAVGTVSGPGWSRGLVLRSPDGRAWTIVDLALEGVTTGSVAIGPDGFLIGGFRILAMDTYQPIALRSRDGVAWEEIPVGNPGPYATFGARWAGDRWLMPAAEGRGTTDQWFELTSTNGAEWTRLDLEATRLPVATSIGWRAVDGAGRWTMIDGGEAGIAPLPESGDGDRTRWPPQTAVLGGGTLVVGEVDDRCGWQDACGTQSAAWWSSDGQSYGAIPTGTPGWPFHAVTFAAGDGLAFVVEAGSASVSADGWRWAPLVDQPQPDLAAGPETSVYAAAATGDRLVLVGSHDGSVNDGGMPAMQPWIALAAP